MMSGTIPLFKQIRYICQLKKDSHLTHIAIAEKIEKDFSLQMSEALVGRRVMIGSLHPAVLNFAETITHRSGSEKICPEFLLFILAKSKLPPLVQYTVIVRYSKLEKKLTKQDTQEWIEKISLDVTNGIFENGKINVFKN